LVKNNHNPDSKWVKTFFLYVNPVA
jgi:hypothetical protein